MPHCYGHSLSMLDGQDEKEGYIIKSSTNKRSYYQISLKENLLKILFAVQHKHVLAYPNQHHATLGIHSTWHKLSTSLADLEEVSVKIKR